MKDIKTGDTIAKAVWHDEDGWFANTPYGIVGPWRTYEAAKASYEGNFPKAIDLMKTKP